MPIQVKWLDEEHKIILNKYTGKWDWTELFNAIEQSASLMDTVDHKVAVILDMSATNHVPTLNLGAMQKIVGARTSHHPNMTHFYMVGIKVYVRAMTDIFSRLFPRAFAQYKVVKSVEEALEKIHLPQVTN